MNWPINGVIDIFAENSDLIMPKQLRIRENSLSRMSSMNPSLKQIENLKQTSSENIAISIKKVRGPSSKKKQAEEEKSDHLLLKNLQAYVSDLTEDNQRLRDKNTELEALLAAAHDEIRDHETALLELSDSYEELVKKFNDLSAQKRQKKDKCKKLDKSK